MDECCRTSNSQSLFVENLYLFESLKIFYYCLASIKKRGFFPYFRSVRKGTHFRIGKEVFRIRGG